MADEPTKTCVDCDGTMLPIAIMDHMHRGSTVLHYRMPDDKVSFWTGGYPTAGAVNAFMCAGCGRIALYGALPKVE